MERKIAKTKIYNVDWEDRLYFISLNFNKDDIIVNHLRPPELFEILPYTNHSEREFLNIWTRFIIGLSVCSNEKDPLEKNIGALTFTVMDSILTKGKISFDELLKHVDCFSMMLKEEGYENDKIRGIYLAISKAILSNFKGSVLDSVTGEKFIETPKYKEFEKLGEEKY